MRRLHLFAIVSALAATLSGLFARLFGTHFDPQWEAGISGSAIIGASFLLLWACDAAQAEVSQAIALAVVALIAVLPEYSVDMYFTWQAGKNPAGGYAHYAIANMTGANRLLIGVAWGAIVALFWLRFRRSVRLEKERRTELLFLAVATLYALAIPLKGTLAWYDGLVFLGIYVAYIIVASRHCCGDCEVEGPAAAIARLPKAPRRAATAAMFLFAGAVILLNAKSFCEGLIGTGRALHISEFLLVQWLAPLASEAPEFVVALMFAWRGEAGLALGSLLSAKLNQWTLLVGMIPGVFGMAHGSFAHPIPMDTLQMHEILLTAAQSVLAVVLLAGLRLSIGGALLLFGLFFGQFVLPVTMHPGQLFGLTAGQIHPVFSFLYLAAAIAIVLNRPKRFLRLVRGRKTPVGAAPCAGPEPEFKTAHCRNCRWRKAAEAHDRELIHSRN